MKSSIFSLIVISLLSACATTSNHTTEMLNSINAARAKARTCGDKHFQAAAPLRWNEKLANAAQKHAQEMADNRHFSHNSKDGKKSFDRIKAEGYQFWTTAENIAHGQSNVKEVMKSWLSSPRHCANLMNPNITEVGMAGAYNRNLNETPPVIYWVQDFGEPR
ncbi:CAP domain-containing protein [Kingella negevensis]|uniref:Cysteine-rich secretory protein family protein n=2 Tax=Kingella negevensis TaxID=1522312 RepID=A0A238T9E2_9NEIS|nr:CAP domain-containing protein [Kingella negevensis]MDK4681301.1 CAP domain-containing protein [Kingella negevensis]MDK4683498.1 CAP domain-containing protein [Kingella negevensis]MDK4684057.1 CAP domain-containing protein [Kingella negevensis]MDK4691367.1 CAP domain-containing protein [Kingella negevensis]MDK4693484.1 CAP domain-containing protein [Kingella negevensis]